MCYIGNQKNRGIEELPVKITQSASNLKKTKLVIEIFNDSYFYDIVYCPLA
jgi:hypothetical protein